MAQFGLPTDDISKGTAPPAQCSGDGDANAFDELDEGFGAGRGSGSGPDDGTTHWTTETFPDEATTHIECGLNSLTDPASSTGHVIRVRCVKAQNCTTLSGSGQQNDITVQLKQGATVRATLTIVGLGGTWTTAEYTLTSGEADAITDYTDLSLRYFTTEVGGGAGRTTLVSAYEFECPDAGGGGGAQPNRITLLGVGA